MREYCYWHILSSCVYCIFLDLSVVTLLEVSVVLVTDGDIDYETPSTVNYHRISALWSMINNTLLGKSCTIFCKFKQRGGAGNRPKATLDVQGAVRSVAPSSPKEKSDYSFVIPLLYWQGKNLHPSPMFRGLFHSVASMRDFVWTHSFVDCI
jgi:hypothetical protein